MWIIRILVQSDKCQSKQEVGWSSADIDYRQYYIKPAVSQLANTAPRAASIDQSATMSESICAFVRSLVGFARQMSDDRPL